MHFFRSFLPIHTPEQRNRYKAEFNSDYKEYMRLHSVIDKVSKLFAHLDERLRQAEHGSHDYNVSISIFLMNQYYYSLIRNILIRGTHWWIYRWSRIG